MMHLMATQGLSKNEWHIQIEDHWARSHYLTDTITCECNNDLLIAVVKKGKTADEPGKKIIQNKVWTLKGKTTK